jgi:NAD(P)-dependent dehydrogenase (short-subunit alcohol dehydrogenase family)
MAREQTNRHLLATRVVVVPDSDGTRGASIARALASLDAAIVVTGDDAEALGVLAAELGSEGSRVAVLVDDVATDAGRAALVEMVNELFPPANT